MEFLRALNWVQIIAIATAAGSIFFAVKQYLPAMPALSLGKASAEDDDVADLHALKRLEARAVRSACPKLQEAVRAVEVCFFNHGSKPVEA